MSERLHDAEGTDLAPPGTSIVVPAMNEAEGLRVVLEELEALAPRLEGPVEILVVDDGSTDATPAIAREHGVRLVSHPARSGYGAALKTGIRAARYERIVTLDADGTYPAEEIPVLLEHLRNHDMVVGARTGPRYRRMALLSPMRTVFLLLANFVAGTWIPDPNSGMRAISRSLACRLLDALPRAFSFTTTLTLILTLQGYFIRYQPIPYRRRIGRRKVRPVLDALRVAQTLVEVILQFNPLKLFLLLGLVPLSLAVILGLAIPARDGGVIAAAILGGTAILTFAVGMAAVARPPRDPPGGDRSSSRERERE